MYIYCNKPSASAAKLKRALRLSGVHARRLYLPNFPTSGLIINWGCVNGPQATDVTEHFKVLNLAASVWLASSKINTLDRLKEEEVPHILISKDIGVARGWLKNGFKVLVRKDGLSKGRGISLFTGDEILRDQTWFYSRVFQKTHEFRCHVALGKAIDLVQKKRRDGTEEASERLIRSYTNNWVFCHDNLTCTPEDRKEIEEVSVEACRALNLDFGAVDVLCIFNKGNPRRLTNLRVCEINTRPGLENSKTIEAYVEAFKSA